MPPNHPNYDAEMEKIGQQMAADLIADYPPAFGDHLEPGVTVDHPSMRIHINEDATPVNVTVARDYPPGRREACLQLEKEMEDAGISQWWSWSYPPSVGLLRKIHITCQVAAGLSC